MPHSNGEGLFAAFKFNLTMPLKRGEKIVIVVPHLVPKIDEAVIDMFLFDEAVKADTGGADTFRYDTEGTERE